MHNLKWALLLLGFWLLLSGYLQPLLITFGVISVGLVVLVIHKMDEVDQLPKQVSSGRRIIRYFTWLIIEITKSSIHVTKLIWGAKEQINPAIAKVKIEKIPLNTRVLYTNSITLTPGTLSIDLVGDEILVHSLQKESVKKLQTGQMEKQLTKIWGERS